MVSAILIHYSSNRFLDTLSTWQKVNNEFFSVGPFSVEIKETDRSFFSSEGLLLARYRFSNNSQPVEAVFSYKTFFFPLFLSFDIEYLNSSFDLHLLSYYENPLPSVKCVGILSFNSDAIKCNLNIKKNLENISSQDVGSFSLNSKGSLSLKLDLGDTSFFLDKLKIDFNNTHVTYNSNNEKNQERIAIHADSVELHDVFGISNISFNGDVVADVVIPDGNSSQEYKTFAILLSSDIGKFGFEDNFVELFNTSIKAQLEGMTMDDFFDLWSLSQNSPPTLEKIKNNATSYPFKFDFWGFDGNNYPVVVQSRGFCKGCNIKKSQNNYDVDLKYSIFTDFFDDSFMFFFLRSINLWDCVYFDGHRALGSFKLRNNELLCKDLKNVFK